MSALTLADAKAHINVYIDDDDVLIQNKINAAETWLGLFLGADLSTFIPSGGALPDPLLEATRQLVAHLYANREASLTGTNIIENTPGLYDMLGPYRDYVF